MESTGPKIRYLRNLNLIFSPTNIHIMRYMLAIIALLALFSSCQPDLVSQGKAPVSLSNIDLSQPLSVAVADTPVPVDSIKVWTDCRVQSVPVANNKTDQLDFKEQLACSKYVGVFYLYEGVVIVTNSDNLRQEPYKIRFASPSLITTLAQTEFGSYVTVRARYDLKTESLPTDASPLLVKIE